MESYQARRQENFRQNQKLLDDLGLHENPIPPSTAKSKAKAQRRPAAKRRKLQAREPTRTSTRIANASSRPTYVDDGGEDERASSKRKPRSKAASQSTSKDAGVSPHSPQPRERPDLDSLIASWSSWTPSAPPPTCDDQGTYHFESHPTFTPNKSPEAIIREGCFGGSYWRPLYSRHLRATISDDWRELPESWVSGLSVERHLTSPTYDPDVNKYGVACGQSIEQWEAAGWIAHDYDVRGWFQWYCRFWLGRRCDDDERQISRWRKCVGGTGRWRRTLLKKYVQLGIRSATDEGDEVGNEEMGDVSPVVHQTCHHWAWEVRQEALDRFWAEGR